MSEAHPLRVSPPPPVRWITKTLERAGHEAWCVGGAVRDVLLGIEHLDWDIATSATPPEVRRLFRRTVPVGVEFGTIGVLDDAGVLHEVTTFRRDVRTDGRHAVVEFGASLEEDLARRDFTINAIAYSPTRDELRDPFGGRQDLAGGVVRAVGQAVERMREDRLRALRAIRFAARFGFQIEGATWRAIVESAPHLTRLSAERVKQEIEKTMQQVARPSVAFEKWRTAGALATLVPALAAVRPIDLAPIDFLPPPGLAGRPQRGVLRVAALFASVPSREVVPALKALRFSNAESAWIGMLVERWHILGEDMSRVLMDDGPIPDETVRRWIATAGRTRFASLLRLAAAIWSARREGDRPAPAPARVRGLYRRALRVAYRDPVEIADLAIDGDDIQRLGIRGPAVGRILQGLLEEVLTDPSRNDPALLEAAARRIADALAAPRGT